MRPLTSLDDWSLDVLTELASIPDGEPGWFEFKEYPLIGLDIKQKRDVCKVACGMANSEGGGFLIFGVKNSGTAEQRLVGIPLRSEPCHDFAQVTNKIQRPIRFDAKVIEWRNDLCFVIVQVMSVDVLRPHMSQHDGVFYERGDGGEARAMSYQQVRDTMVLGQERRQRIFLFAAKLSQYFRIAENVEKAAAAKQAQLCFDRFDTVTYENLLSEIMSVISSNTLIETLMQISESTSWANTAMNFSLLASAGRPQGLNDEQHLRLRSEAETVKRCCIEAQREMVKSFGPFPSGIREL